MHCLRSQFCTPEVPILETPNLSWLWDNVAGTRQPKCYIHLLTCNIMQLVFNTAYQQGSQGFTPKSCRWSVMNLWLSNVQSQLLHRSTTYAVFLLTVLCYRKLFSVISLLPYCWWAERTEKASLSPPFDPLEKFSMLQKPLQGLLEAPLSIPKFSQDTPVSKQWNTSTQSNPSKSSSPHPHSPLHRYPHSQPQSAPWGSLAW